MRRAQTKARNGGHREVAEWLRGATGKGAGGGQRAINKTSVSSTPQDQYDVNGNGRVIDNPETTVQSKVKTWTGPWNKLKRNDIAMKQTIKGLKVTICFAALALMDTSSA